MINEIFKTIEDFPDYEVSNLGNVKSNKNKKRNGKIVSILKSQIKRNGYSCVHLVKDRKVFTKNIHRLVAETFLEKIEGKPQVHHLDGDRINNNLPNLKWVNHKENSSVENLKLNLWTRLEGRNKFTDNEIITIYFLVTNGKKSREICKEFNISIQHLQSIKNKKTRKHLWK